MFILRKVFQVLAVPFHRLVIVRPAKEADDAGVFRLSGMQEKVRRWIFPADVLERRYPVGRNVGELPVLRCYIQSL